MLKAYNYFDRPRKNVENLYFIKWFLITLVLYTINPDKEASMDAFDPDSKFKTK